MQNKNKKNTISIEILTPTGYQKFDGIARYYHGSFLRIHLSNRKHVDTAIKHKFVVDGDIIFADKIKIGMKLGNLIVESIEKLNQGDWFYDPINVKNGSVYYHDDDILSHNTFYGTGNTLIDVDTLMALKAQPPIHIKNSVKVYEEPITGHSYIMTVDVSKGRGSDYSTFNVIDVSQKPFKQVAVYRNNKIPSLLFPDEIIKWAKAYNEAYVIVESNDEGVVVCNALHHDLEYENLHMSSVLKSNRIGVEMTRKSKRIGCVSFKNIIESGQLHVVDEDTISEISTFELNGQSWEASDGNHDDLVMNLVLFGYFASTQSFSNLADLNLRQFLYEEKMRLIEEDVLPFGFIDDGQTNEIDQDERFSPAWSIVKTDDYEAELYITPMWST